MCCLTLITGAKMSTLKIGAKVRAKVDFPTARHTHPNPAVHVDVPAGTLGIVRNIYPCSQLGWDGEMNHEVDWEVAGKPRTIGYGALHWEIELA